MSDGGWFYLPFGVMTHYRDAVTGGFWPESACAIEPDDPDGWRGTGSQEERDRVAFLPRCRICKNETRKP